MVAIAIARVRAYTQKNFSGCHRQVSVVNLTLVPCKTMYFLCYGSTAFLGIAFPGKAIISVSKLLPSSENKLEQKSVTLTEWCRVIVSSVFCIPKQGASWNTSKRILSLFASLSLRLFPYHELRTVLQESRGILYLFALIFEDELQVNGIGLVNFTLIIFFIEPSTAPFLPLVLNHDFRWSLLSSSLCLSKHVKNRCLNSVATENKTVTLSQLSLSSHSSLTSRQPG